MKLPLLDVIFYIAAARMHRQNQFDSVAPNCDAAANISTGTNQTCDERQMLRQSQTNIPLPVNSSNRHLEKGSLVEVYGERSYFATPSIIQKQSDSSPGRKYFVQNTITGQLHRDVDLDFIHPYQAYQSGTEAHCNIGSLRNAKLYLTPCVVESSSVKGKSGFISYKVSYMNDDTKERVEIYLPFSKVQRKNDRPGKVAAV